MAPVLILPLESLVWVGSEAGIDEVTGSVRVFKVESVLLFPRVIVLIGLGVASGFPGPRPFQKHSGVYEEVPDLRSMAIATVSLKV